MKSFRVPIFKTRIFFTRDFAEAQAWEEKHNFEVSLIGLDGICSNDRGNILVYVKTDDPALLAHECFHAANYTLDFIDAEGRDEEIVANLLQWIMRECLNRL